MGQRSWELAESELQRPPSGLRCRKATLLERSLDLILQRPAQPVHRLVFSVHARECALSRQYGACSTMAQGLALGGLSGRERRGRPPACGSFLAFLLGGKTIPPAVGIRRPSARPPHSGQQRRPARQCLLLGRRAARGMVIIGKMQDLGIKDANNMGAAWRRRPARPLPLSCMIPAQYRRITI